MDFSAVFLVLLGLIGGLVLTVIPVAPAGLTIPAALAFVMVLRGWHSVPWWCWVIQLAFVVLLFAIDNIMHAFGIAKLGASRDAMVWGGTAVVLAPIGLGMVFGPVGGIVGAPLGAVVGTIAGELRSRTRLADEVATDPPTLAPPPTGDAWARTAAVSSRSGAPGDAANGPVPGQPRLAHLGIAAFAAWVAGLFVRIGLVTVQAVVAVVAVWNT
ncbi:MAG: DUF456 domain-containing protein [Thermoleophilia bacterium]|nr:DUF456 domain-containing protein [Thermoleophilia bacterium]